ncbi:hypothetical protein ACFOPX_06600 [Helicobacter baculiformis]|uniref:Uncharacterized protein n=1 Tax=Helicobacter baculiformis TaxID=427351 RepID=A0ABV7ZHY4_9HELI|nr:hypothetical protein [Helicobacter baculiformis]
MRKIGAAAKHFCVKEEGLCWEGEVRRAQAKLYLVEGKLYGHLEVQCASSGTLFEKPISQEMVLCICDGLYTSTDRECYVGGKILDSMDVVESFDGCIDLSALLHAEIQSIRQDYHYANQNQIQ